MADVESLPGKPDMTDPDAVAADIYSHAHKLYQKEPVVAVDYMLRLYALHYLAIGITPEDVDDAE